MHLRRGPPVDYGNTKSNALSTSTTALRDDSLQIIVTLTRERRHLRRAICLNRSLRSLSPAEYPPELLPYLNGPGAERFFSAGELSLGSLQIALGSIHGSLAKRSGLE